MLAVIVLFVFLELDYHMLKIDARALWKVTYVHFVLFGLIPVFRDQINDRSNFKAKNNSDIRDFNININKRIPPIQLCNEDTSV
jgi:hypothetical protein